VEILAMRRSNATPRVVLQALDFPERVNPCRAVGTRIHVEDRSP
jgi:hypothetical protein